MRKTVYSIIIIIAVFIGIMSLTSCKAIEAQKITHTKSTSETYDKSSMNGGQSTDDNAEKMLS